jgi:hypothetical protein
VIDENKIKTPYRINDEGALTYTDHNMMILTTSLIVEKKEEPRKYISEKGYQRLQEKMEEQEISKILDVEDFDRTYAEWSDKVLQIVDECSTKRKKSKGWKVNRKLESFKKTIKQKLKDATLDKETVRLLKVESMLVTDHIEDELRKKHYKNVNMEVDKIKKEGGVDSTVFWELKRRIEGKRNEETAHMMENEDGDIVEEKKEILEVYKNYYQKLLTTKPGETEAEKEAEEITKIAMEAIELLAQGEDPEIIEDEAVEKSCQ